MKISASSFRRVVLSVIGLLAATSFVPQLYVFGVPLFQVVLVFAFTMFLIVSGGVYSSKDQPYRDYCLYLLLSVPAIIYGAFTLGGTSILISFYSIVPLLLYMVLHNRLGLADYHVLLSSVLISVAAITILGWVIRLNLIPRNAFFDVMEPEFNLGYWGIRYTQSTRNADYLYPLVGLGLSAYFYRLGSIRFLGAMLMITFGVTLLASQSRGAIIAVVLFMTIFYFRSKGYHRIILYGLVVALALLFSSAILGQYSETYSRIIGSIFSFGSIDGSFSNSERLMILIASLESALINPVGWGVGNFMGAIEFWDEKHIFIGSAENAFVTILVERGWGAFTFLGLFFFHLIMGASRRKWPSISTYLLPLLVIYFCFNYELNGIFANFLLLLVLLDSTISKSEPIT